MPRTLGQKSKACYALRIKVSDLQTFNLLYSIRKKIIGLGHFRRVENNDWPKWKLEEWSILIEILENFLLPQWSGSWNSFTKITYQRKLRPCGYNFWLDYWLAIPLFPHHRSAFSAKEWLTAHTPYTPLILVMLNACKLQRWQIGTIMDVQIILFWLDQMAWEIIGLLSKKSIGSLYFPYQK